MKIKRNSIYFVLVEPQHPGNIGASARALKTMGFRNFILINPVDFDVPETHFMAHASADILKGTQTKNTLKEALEEMDFVIATTQRNRGYHLPYYTPKELAEKIIPISQDSKVAIVFGREDSGLTNQELRACHVTSTIPASVKHPALNLSQSVMLYCYELYNSSFHAEKKYHWKHASYREIEGVFVHLQESLKAIGFQPKDSWDNFIMRFQRLFARANPESRDVKLMHKIFQSFDEYISVMKESGARK